MLGSIDSEHATNVALAKALQVVVVAVEYRLAPEHPYPAGLEDCYAALSWMSENADSLGVDPDRIAVYGQSAGGGLAAALALLARDRGGPSICFQFLGMPELDDRLQTTSMKNFTDTPLWSRPNAILSWEYYLQGEHKRGADDVPYYAAPARAADLSGLPPAYVTAQEFDPLRDEDLIYAMRLLEAGVSAEVHMFPGTFHGSILIRAAEISRLQEEEMITVFRRALA